jgi:hypothetical protein
VAPLAAGTPVKIYKKQAGNGDRYRYGLAHLKSEKEGRKLIRRLHGAEMRGNSLEAREFGHRRASNERRRLDWRSVPWRGPERRKGERRAPDY